MLPQQNPFTCCPGVELRPSRLDGGRATVTLAHVVTWMVISVGLEPTRPCGHRILNPARMPISPGDRGASGGIRTRVSRLATWHMCLSVTLAFAFTFKELNLHLPASRQVFSH